MTNFRILLLYGDWWHCKAQGIPTRRTSTIDIMGRRVPVPVLVPKFFTQLRNIAVYIISQMININTHAVPILAERESHGRGEGGFHPPGFSFSSQCTCHS